MQPEVEVLGQDELHAIHSASVEVLERVGVAVKHPDALRLLSEAGCWVEDASTVRIPYHVVERSLAACVPVATLYGRGGHPPLKVGGRRVYFGTQGWALNVHDWRTGEYRSAGTQDLVEAARLAEALPNVDFFMPPGGLTDVPPEVEDRHQWRISLEHTGKHIVNQAYGAEGVRDAVRIAAALAGGEARLKREPFISVFTCIDSPLLVSFNVADVVMETARQGLPLSLDSGPMCGANAPATLAAVLVMTNAETLAYITLAKLANPELALIYTSWARPFDMKVGGPSLGGPEFGLLRVATTQLARYYRLPSGGGVFCTDSKTEDAQMGAEKMSTALLAALAGTNMMYGMSMIEGNRTVSLATMLIEDDFAGHIKRVMRGIHVDDDTLGVEVIRKVGPEGQYLGEEHTRTHYRREMWIPSMRDRSIGLEAWVAAGSPDIATRARQLLPRILQQHDLAE